MDNVQPVAQLRDRKLNTQSQPNSDTRDLTYGTIDEHYSNLLKCNDPIESKFKAVGHSALPDWYDEKLFKAGQAYYQRNTFSMTLVGMFGLLTTLLEPSSLKIMISTKKSGMPCSAFKRYVQTILHIHALYTADINDETSNWWKSLNTIRWKHATASKKTSRIIKESITQRTMGLTQFGFIGYALLTPEQLSLTNEEDEREGLNHFWRVVGRLLGIDDKINICRTTAKETTELCRQLLDNVFAKEMITSPPGYDHMTRALLDGLWSLDVSLDYDAFKFLWYEINGLKYNKPLSIYSWLNVQYRNFVLWFFKIPYVGDLGRYTLNQYLSFLYTMSQYGNLIAWLRFDPAYRQLILYPALSIEVEDCPVSVSPNKGSSINYVAGLE